MSENPGLERGRAADRAWIPYVLPMVLFLGVTQLESWLPKGTAGGPSSWYPAVYAAKLLAVGAALLVGRNAWGDFRIETKWSSLLLGALVGVLVFGLWIGLDGRYPAIPLLGSRVALDPSVLGESIRRPFLLIRFLGLVVIVPVVEELFWRSFLIRLLIDMDDFTRVPVGRVTVASGVIVAVLFALAHPEWLPALLTGLAWSFLLARTRSLGACLASHVVANGLLGGYVLATGAWHLW